MEDCDASGFGSGDDYDRLTIHELRLTSYELWDMSCASRLTNCENRP